MSVVCFISFFIDLLNGDPNSTTYRKFDSIRFAANCDCIKDNALQLTISRFTLCI